MCGRRRVWWHEEGGFRFASALLLHADSLYHRFSIRFRFHWPRPFQRIQQKKRSTSKRYTSSLRPHALVASGLNTSSLRPYTLSRQGARLETAAETRLYNAAVSNISLPFRIYMTRRSTSKRKRRRASIYIHTYIHTYI